MNRIICILFLLLCASFAVKGQDPATLKKAQAGDAKAQWSIGLFYMESNNIDEGIKWLTKSAEQEHADAQFYLADIYKRGRYGIPANNDNYIYWLIKLSENTNLKDDKFLISYGQNDLAELYKTGGCGLEKNMEKYIKWMKKSAFNGFSPAAYDLGLHYKRTNDKQEAIYWLKKCMDMEWDKHQEEDEYAFSKLRELGVTYHPADHVGHTHSESVAASASAASTTNNQGNQVREYIETVPVQAWQPCGGCNGSGQCQVCYGSGWILNYNGGKSSCSACHGSGKCTLCAGHGGQNVTRYEQRTVYR